MTSVKDRKMARTSLGEENQAVKSYTKRLKLTRSAELRAAFKHALGEEKTHARLFREAAKS